MERVMGIEPTRPAWKAGILPLNYTRISTLYYYITFFSVCQGLFAIFFKIFEFGGKLDFLAQQILSAIAFFRLRVGKMPGGKLLFSPKPP